MQLPIHLWLRLMHPKKTLSKFNKIETEPGEIGDRRKQIKIRAHSIKVWAVKESPAMSSDRDWTGEGGWGIILLLSEEWPRRGELRCSGADTILHRGVSASSSSSAQQLPSALAHCHIGGPRTEETLITNFNPGQFRTSNRLNRTSDSMIDRIIETDYI